MPSNTAIARHRRSNGAPRDFDNVLWRSPTGLKRRVEETARSCNLSQNALITSSMLYTTIVFGPVERNGSPAVLKIVVDELDAAVRADDAVLSAMHAADWELAADFVNMLDEGGWIAGLRTRPDARNSGTIVYTYHPTKEGVAAWQCFGPRIFTAITELAEKATPRKASFPELPNRDGEEPR